MHFIISRQKLCDLLKLVQDIVAIKTPMPLLSNFLLEAKDSRIILTATDLTVGIRCTGEAKVVQEGATTLPARRFAQLVRELTASQIEIATDEKHSTQVIAASSKFRIHGLAPSEFPQLPDFSDAEVFSFNQKALRDALYKTAFAVSKEDSRYVLTGVFLQVCHEQATFIGTDGKKMARFSLAVDKSQGSFQDSSQDLSQGPSQNPTLECIIPIKAIDEAIKALTNDDEMCTLSVMKDKIAISTSDVFLVSKLLTGDYPDVDRIIPEQSDCVVALHREELMSLLRQMSLFMTEESHSVRFSFTDGELKIRANTSNIGEGTVCMPVNYTGERFDIAFNPTFFLDILRHSSNETVSLGFTDPFNPGMLVDGALERIHQQLPPQLFVLMPLRLTESSV